MLSIVEGSSLTVVTLAVIFDMYVSTNIWSSTRFTKMLSIAFAGALLIVWLFVLIGLMIHTKCTEMRRREQGDSDRSESGETEQTDQTVIDHGEINKSSSGHLAKTHNRKWCWIW